MATSRYFNHHSERSEQALYEDLFIEQIQLFGYDVWYVPRTILELDNILGDPVKTIFERAYPIEGLFTDYGTFGGEQDFMSKFGWRLSQTSSLLISKKRFKELQIPNYIQPKAGDVIYAGEIDNAPGSFPNLFFEITNVIYDLPGSLFGRDYTFKLSLETFAYSHEKFRTGIKTIDALEKESPVQDKNSEYDQSAINKNVLDEKIGLLKFDTDNPFGNF